MQHEIVVRICCLLGSLRQPTCRLICWPWNTTVVQRQSYAPACCSPLYFFFKLEQSSTHGKAEAAASTTHDTLSIWVKQQRYSRALPILLRTAIAVHSRIHYFTHYYTLVVYVCTASSTAAAAVPQRLVWCAAPLFTRTHTYYSSSIAHTD